MNVDIVIISHTDAPSVTKRSHRRRSYGDMCWLFTQRRSPFSAQSVAKVLRAIKFCVVIPCATQNRKRISVHCVVKDFL